jgi:nucleotide-binding universal stress UspA family protein
MSNLEHILAATDLSANSIYAIDRGYRIAAAHGARYTVMYALGIESMKPLRRLLGEDIEAVSQKITKDARELLSELCARPTLNRGVTADLRIDQGIAGTAIPEFAIQNHVDLMLIGAHGKDLVQRVLLGSTASRLVRKSRWPVLIVRKLAETDYTRVLVTIDFSPASVSAIRLARMVAPCARLTLLHAYEVPFESKMQYAGVSQDIIIRYRAEALDEATKQIHELARSCGLADSDYAVTVVHGDPTRQILEHERQGGCDLIVTGKHGTHVVEELLLGSVTNHLLAESESDILVVGDKRRPVMDLFDN